MIDCNYSTQHFKNLYFNTHICAALLSYASFSAAFFAAVLYLIQDNYLKSKKTKEILNRLPDLSFLDRLNYMAIGFGFPIFTVSIVSGLIWAERVRGTWWGNGPRDIYAIALWLIYALILHVRLSAKLRGKKVAFLSIFAFCIIIFTLFSSCH